MNATEQTKPGFAVLFRTAFLDSLPVCAGYVAMGFAAGVLLAVHGGLADPLPDAVISSGLCISGALQFMLVEWIRNGTALWQVAFLTICLNLRYAVFGLSLLEEFGATSRLKRCYLIWTLTDETWALEVRKLRELEREEAPKSLADSGQFDLQARARGMSGLEITDGKEAGQQGSGPDLAGKERPGKVIKARPGLSASAHNSFMTYCLSLAGLNHGWWVLGVSAGAVAGSVELPFASTGIDFAMTALFIVIMVDQWRGPEGRLPAIVGIVVASVCLLGFGPSQMLPPTIAALLAIFLIWRQRFGWQALMGK